MLTFAQLFLIVLVFFSRTCKWRIVRDELVVTCLTSVLTYVCMILTSVRMYVCLVRVSVCTDQYILRCCSWAVLCHSRARHRQCDVSSLRWYKPHISLPLSLSLSLSQMQPTKGVVTCMPFPCVLCPAYRLGCVGSFNIAQLVSVICIRCLFSSNVLT